MARLDDELILAAAHEGETAFVAEALARRAGLDGATAAGELLSGIRSASWRCSGMAGSPRELVAGLLASIGDLLGIADAGACHRPVRRR